MTVEKTLRSGSIVEMVNCIEAKTYKDVVWVTKGEPWQLGNGEWVVKLEGFKGGFSMKKLKKVIG